MLKKKMELLKSKTGLNETLNDLGNVISFSYGTYRLHWSHS